jgi:hypothetical protein
MINKLVKKNTIMECFLDHSECKGCPRVASVDLENKNLENLDVNSNRIWGKNLDDNNNSDDGANLLRMLLIKIMVMIVIFMILTMILRWMIMTLTLS